MARVITTRKWNVKQGFAGDHPKAVQATDGKKKSKYVPLFSAEGQAKSVAKLPGNEFPSLAFS